MCDAALSDAASVCRVAASRRHEDDGEVVIVVVRSLIGALNRKLMALREEFLAAIYAALHAMLPGSHYSHLCAYQTLRCIVMA
jgi:hypothetical protein